MAQDPFVNSSAATSSDIAPMEVDAPITTVVEEPVDITKTGDTSSNQDPSFIQNQISIQRSPSTAKSHISTLSKKLSTKSNSSPRSTLSPSSKEEDRSQEEDRGRQRGDFDSSIVEATNNCSLSKSNSTSSALSVRSEKSAKSVRSVNVVGSYPLGSLRVHSPSPPRQPAGDHHEVLKDGDVFIVRNIPGGSIFGYDTRSFTIQNKDHKFEGVRDIPPGAHFVWGGSSNGSSRTGFWLMSMKRASSEYGEIHVLRWDNYNESLDEEVSEAEKRIQKASISEITNRLESYVSNVPTTTTAQDDPSTSSATNSASASPTLPSDADMWHRLTSSIKHPYLSKVTGGKWNNWKVTSSHDVKQRGEPKDVPSNTMDFSRDDVLSFVFPKAVRTFSELSFGRDRTEQAMDTSAHIMAIISGNCTYEDSDEIIGELQFCYITGMVLGNLACMEQWGNIVRVVFRAFRLAMDMPVFFRKVIEAVHAQFIYDDQGFESSIFDHDSNLTDDLKMILTVFKSRLNEQLLSHGSLLTREQQEVGTAFEAFESWLWKWGWDLRGNYVRSGKFQLEDGEIIDAELKDFEAEDERGEYAPVIVDLDEEGREKDLIRW
jgi:A1 cistron-splicing factor AAR2